MKYDPDEEEPEPGWQHRFFISQKREPLPTLFDEDGYPFIQFAPVPQLRRRRVGWDAERQQAFIALLARVPSVSHAARLVGMSARSAYKLLDKPGADEFAQAWDMAIDHGMTRLRHGAMTRCMENADFVPVYRRGKLVRVEHRHNDRLAIALLSGREKNVDSYRQGALTRWRQKREWALADAHKAAEAEARRQAILDAAARAEAEWKARPRPEPRVRTL